MKIQNVKQEIVENRRDEMNKVEIIEEEEPLETSAKCQPIIEREDDFEDENLIAYEIEDVDDDVNVQFIEYEYEQVEYLEVDPGSEEQDIISFKTEADPGRIFIHHFAQVFLSLLDLFNNLQMQKLIRLGKSNILAPSARMLNLEQCLASIVIYSLSIKKDQVR